MKQLDRQAEAVIASNPTRAKHLFENIVYIKNSVSYYDKKLEKMFKINDLTDLTIIKKPVIEEFRLNGLIDEYNGIIFSSRDKEGYYNLFNRDILLSVANDNKKSYHKDISLLLEKVSGGDENKQYLEKLIWYKYMNPTDHTIPCVILHGNGGIGKGQFCKMLGNIFGGEKYCTLGLGQEALIGNFSYYKGDKLIIEFAEVYSHDTHQDKIVMNKLKNMIGQDTIVVNQKFQAPYTINNPALFFITSNYEKPVHFDANTGNRRFTVIKSIETALTVTEAEAVNTIINDREALSGFLAHLKDKYGNEVSHMKGIRALENDDKRALTMASLSDSQRFWQYMSTRYFGEKIFWKDLLESVNGTTSIFDGGTSDSKYISGFISENTDVDQYQLKKWIGKECPFTKKTINIDGKTSYGIKIDRKLIN